MSHARSPKARMARASVDLTKVEVRAELESSAEETTIARQSARIVERALAEMTRARREAFILLRYEGMRAADGARSSAL